MSIAILPLSSELHLTETVKGQISSAFSAGYGLAIIPCGLLVATVSPRVIMACGISLWSFGTILTPWATQFISSNYQNLLVSSENSSPIPTDQLVFVGILPLLVIRGVVGAAESLVLPTIQRFLANWVPKGRKSVAVASIFAGFQTGTIAAYLLSPNAMEQLGGWRELFYLYGTVGILWLVPWWLFAQDSPTALPTASTTSASTTIDLDTDGKPTFIASTKKDTKKPNVITPEMDVEDAMECTLTNTGLDDDASLILDCKSGSTSGASSSTLNTVSTGTIQQEASKILKSAPWKQLATTPSVIAITVAHAANNWGLYNNLSWTPTFYAEQYGLNVRDSALLSLIPSIAGAIGGLSSGAIADYVIKQEWFGKVVTDENGNTEFDTTNIRKVFQGIALLGPSLCLTLLSSHIPDAPTSAQLLLTGSVGLQAFNAAGYGASCQEKAGKKWAGLLYSITSLPGVMFGTLGVYLTGQILDATGNNWSLVFACNAAINVVGALAFIFFYDAKREFE